LSKLVRVTGTLENLNLAVNLNFYFLQKYGAAAIFFLYGNKNVPSAEILYLIFLLGGDRVGGKGVCLD
jgi:hypothetical protein